MLADRPQFEIQPSIKHRPLAVITGTSRDVGEFAAYGFAMADWDTIGVYKNPSRDADQARVVDRYKTFKLGKMVAIRQDLLDPTTPWVVAQKVEEFGGNLRALILSAAGGYKKRISEGSQEEIEAQMEESRRINVGANLRLVDTMRQYMGAGSVIIYLTSDPAHTVHTFIAAGEDPMKALGNYGTVALPKNEEERDLRAMIPELSKADIRVNILVGNGLDGSFVIKALKRSDPKVVTQWKGLSPDGFFPILMEMSTVAVRLARGNYPSGYTEYVGIAPEHQLYPEGLPSK